MKTKPNAFLRRGGLGQQAIGKAHRQLDESRVIQQCERLQRRVGTDTPSAGRQAVRRVEHLQRRVRRIAPAVGVGGTSVAILTGARLPGLAMLAKIHAALRLRWEHARATHPRTEHSARGQCHITHQLGVEPEPRLPCEPFVRGINPVDICTSTRCLPVGRRGHE